MKNLYFSFLMLLCAAITFAQNNDFNNGGGDLLWSNTANWSLGVVPTTGNTGQVRLPLTVESLVDTDVTIPKIQTTFATTGGNPAIAGSSTLTIDAGANAAYGIENVSNNDVSIIFNGNLTINNTTTDGISNTLMRNQNGSGNAIIFGDGSLLTINTPLETRSGSTGTFNFNGTLAGTGALRFNANTINTFGSTSDNTGHTGDFVWVGANASVVVNSADNNVFLPSGQKIQINAINGTIEVNGANVFQGNVVVGGSNTFTTDMNANQNGMGTIAFSADGTLNLDVDGAVTELSFADSSAEAWNSGTLNITGFAEGVIRFGTDSNGLTAGQLTQISADNGGEALALDASGFLINASTLSVDDLDADLNATRAYPTLASDKLYFTKPQNDIQIVGLSGNVVFKSEAENQSEVSVDFLAPGFYFVVFENQNVQKFIKK